MKGSLSRLKFMVIRTEVIKKDNDEYVSVALEKNRNFLVKF